ncbi:restriction endonuclease FokI C-terminal domain-containing protein [uncultured Treponema sp.]|uniref:restriction endonuclease FokI C-terminal domain-containing protein n=1 Tax=uncultured Treponema sp. TaxID=162155 RepID=UPI0015BAA36A|nr:restriction endonuclease FokI C-terminal domain-containing protein [uncultured Treponema sp.]
MINFIQTTSKKTRAFGWVQDSGDLNALCCVVALFDETSAFHKELVENKIPVLVAEENGKAEMLNALNSHPIAINYKLLIGSHTTPRNKSPCNGIVQAAVKGQKRNYIGDWPADNFIRWAQAFGFIAYNYDTDTFSITENGKNLVNATDKKELLIHAALSYPPAFRIMSLLKNPSDVLTKFELAGKLGFVGEDGFISYPLASIIAAMANTTDAKERSKIRSDWESSLDKYARTIAQWLVKLGLLENDTKEISLQYGNHIVSDKLGGFRITPAGERYLRNANGNSRHGRNKKLVSYEMFATKGSDREYLRLRRSLILKFLADKKKICTFEAICEFLKYYDLVEKTETVKDDVLGFINLGLELSVDENSAELKDTICDFSIPLYKDLTKKSELSSTKDEIRSQLQYISHEYLSLLDLAFDSSQNRLFEMKTMELFLNEYGFNGSHLGGASKPDGVLFTNTVNTHYGIIVDMKAYSKGYTLPVGQRDEMLRYIRENIDRKKELNLNEWWNIFPSEVDRFYFMFVSGSFKGDMQEKLEKIALVHDVRGTAMSILTVLFVADKIQGKKMSLQDFEKGICNTEYMVCS